MATFKRKLKVSKTDAYVLNVSSWASSEAVTSFSVTPKNALVSVVSTEIVGGNLKMLLTGLTDGSEELHLAFSTATRNDCYIAGLNVVEDC